MNPAPAMPLTVVTDALADLPDGVRYRTCQAGASTLLVVGLDGTKRRVHVLVEEDGIAVLWIARDTGERVGPFEALPDAVPELLAESVAWLAGGGVRR